MKKSWVRLLPKLGTPDEKFHRFNDIFLKHHKNADELVCAKEGFPIAAVYFTPEAYQRKRTKEFFRMLREEMLYRNEMEDE